MAISVADIKAELRISHDFEDALIARKLAAATNFVEDSIGIKLADIEEVPAALEEAIIALTSHLVEWRGVATETAMSEIPAGFMTMLRMNRFGKFPAVVDDGV